MSSSGPSNDRHEVAAAQGRFWNDHNLVREWSAHRRVFWIKNGWHWGWTGGTWRVLELGKVRVWL